MTNLQNPALPNPTNLVEIDWIVQDLQMILDTNLIWLTNSYARAYRHIDKKNDVTLYLPEIYTGKKEGKYTYHPVTHKN